MQFLEDIISKHLIATLHGGPHILVSFAIEDGGKLGAHTHALLMALATTSMAKGKTLPVTRRASNALHPMLVSMWVQK